MFVGIYHFFSSAGNPLYVCYLGLFIILSISIYIFYFCHFKRANQYIKYALVFAVLVLILELFSGILFTQSWIGNAYLFMNMVVFACSGLYCCASLNHRGVPFLRKIFRGSFPKRFSSKGLTLSVLAVLGGYCLYSIFLQMLVPAEIAITPETQVLYSKFYVLTIGIASSIEFALNEEIVFRLGIQSFISKVFNLEGKKYWISIVFTAFLWAIAHANDLNIEWVRFADTFPFGLCLGYLCKKYGVGASIFTHAAFNIFVALISTFLT
ncbi:MAG: CPBP family intramembrane metalloprotease [Clostridia bacterium]|nr:CPBP family intramembrane metalloprotease [Clostridia bacterium]